MVQAIAGALQPEAVNKAIAGAFDAEAMRVYFAGIPTALIDAACVEMGSPAPKGKKAEKAAFAADKAFEAGWLPPELRTVHYSGPGAN